MSDINSQYNHAVLVQVTPAGLIMKSLTDSQLINTFDKENPSNNYSDFGKSYKKMKKLLSSLEANAGQTKEGRNLLLHIHPDIYYDYNEVYDNNHQITTLNHTSETLKDAFYNKATLARFANESPIFTGTLSVPLFRKIKNLNIDQFLDNHKATHYVIKPARGTHAEGVHVVEASQLKNVLNDIRTHETCELVVQVCHLSKPLNYQENIIMRNHGLLFEQIFLL